jgi:hypothetical protein
VDEGLDIRGRYEHALAEVEELKRALRERAQFVAAERELDELLTGRPPGERSARRSAVPPGELERAVAAAERREREAAQELALAQAEREKLDERERSIRKVERELAGLRVQLEQERQRLGGSAPSEPTPPPEPELPAPTPLPQPPPEPDLEPAATRPPRRASGTKRR